MLSKLIFFQSQKFKKSVLLLMIIFGGFPSLASKEIGGGNTVDGVLQDLYEFADATVMEPSALSDLVINQVEKVSPTIPYIFRLFDFAFTKKTWILKPNPRFSQECMNQSALAGEVKVIACQTASQIWIDQTWWESQDNAEKSALIVHEVFLMAALHAKVAQADGRILTALFLKGQSEQLSRIFKDRGFGVLPTLVQIEKAISEILYLKTDTVENRQNTMTIIKKLFARLGVSPVAYSEDHVLGVVEASQNCLARQESNCGAILNLTLRSAWEATYRQQLPVELY